VSIATLHHYNVSTTVELTDENETRLAKFLEDLSHDQEPQAKYHAAVVWGKTGEQDIDDFRPLYFKKEGA